MERLSGYFRSFLLTLTFAWLPDPLITLVTISSVVPAVVHSPGYGGSEVFELFYFDKKKMVVSFLFTQHSDFSCQVSEFFFLNLWIGLHPIWLQPGWQVLHTVKAALLKREIPLASITGEREWVCLVWELTHVYEDRHTHVCLMAVLK